MTAAAPAPDAAGVHGLESLFATTRAEQRAALVGYLPAGFPTVDGSVDTLRAMIDAGCDLVEVGVPFSDPVLDGTVIQSAAEIARRNGFRLHHLFEVVERVSAAGGRAVVMTYFNPVLAYGVETFARDLASAGGLGVITPDLIVDEADAWLAATGDAGLAPTFLVAPSSSAERIARTVGLTRGFLYAAAVMGVTGTRDQVSGVAEDLVRRCRAATTLPIGVGIGVRSREQAADIARFADAVIVGAALVAAAGESRDRLTSLVGELAEGVRGR